MTENENINKEEEIDNAENKEEQIEFTDSQKEYIKAMMERKMKKHIAEIQENHKDQLLRAAAEAENTRKMMQARIEDTGKYAVSSFAKDLINAIENLSRAINSITDIEALDQSSKTLYEGVVMTSKELATVFSRNGIKVIAPVSGEQFNHEFHQAVAQVDPIEGVSSGQIVSCIQNGYVVHDRLLKPAMVTVAKAN